MTLLTKSSYLPGVLVLNHSLKCVKSIHPLVVMVVPSLPADARSILERQNIATRDVDLLHPSDSNNMFHAIQNDRFADTWTKLRYENNCVSTLSKLDYRFEIDVLSLWSLK